MWMARFKTAKVMCPKHKSFNPSIKGQAGIKGGCPYCTQAYVVHTRMRDLVAEVDKLNEMVADHDKAA